MERRVWLALIALVSLVAFLAWPPASSAGRLAVGAEQVAAQAPDPAQGGAKAESQGLPYAAYFPVILTSPPPPTPTATPTTVVSTQMVGYNIRCQTSGDVQVCAAVCSPYPAPYSTLNVYGMLYVNGVAQKNRPVTVRFDFPNGPVTCNTTTEWHGLAICTRDLGAVTRYRTVNVHVTISGYSADTFFTPQ